MLNGCDPTLDANQDSLCSWKKPVKTASFFANYRDGNITNGGAGQMATPGEATGGFCAVSGGNGRRGWTMSLGVGAGAFVALGAALARARRRRR